MNEKCIFHCSNVFELLFSPFWVFVYVIMMIVMLYAVVYNVMPFRGGLILFFLFHFVGNLSMAYSDPILRGSIRCVYNTFGFYFKTPSYTWHVIETCITTVHSHHHLQSFMVWAFCVYVRARALVRSLIYTNTRTYRDNLIRVESKKANENNNTRTKEWIK